MEKNLFKCKLTRNKYSILHNAINDVDYIKKGFRGYVRNKLKIENSDVVLLSVGRLSPEKGCKIYRCIFI